MLTSNHCPAVCAAPVLQRVFSFPSSALAAAPPPLAEADATQPVRDKATRTPASCVPPLLPDEPLLEPLDVPLAPLVDPLLAPLDVPLAPLVEPLLAPLVEPPPVVAYTLNSAMDHQLVVAPVSVWTT
jgi:hypothetical protein